MISKQNYAVVGNPISHSLSPIIHNLFAKEFGLEISYIKQQVDLDTFETYIEDFFNKGGSGLNITIPFKERAFKLCNQVSIEAKAGGVANTLWLGASGELLGSNTDVLGLIKDLTNRLEWQIKGSKILVIGAGGSSRGVLLGLLREKPSKCTVANRSIVRAQELCKKFVDYNEVELDALGIEELKEPYDIIINTTSVSLSNATISFPKEIIGKNTLCYDLAYKLEEKTRFCQWAESMGSKRTSDGLGMLVFQAAESFYLWQKLMPSSEKVLNHILKNTQGL